MFKFKSFGELSAMELYQILALRGEVFVVEQECIYNDVDGKDLRSVHIWIEEEGEIMAYLRVLEPGVSYEAASMGRVVVSPRARGRGLARRMVSEGIRYITQVMDEKTITIGAQEYLKGFYMSLGFEPVSDVYDEDGIPHLDMQYTRA